MAMNDKLRVMVVDDTILYRKIVSDVLAEIPGVEVVGTAHNGKAALAKMATLKPDLVTLDIEMPEMNGLQVLQELKAQGAKVGVIMVSTLTQEGGALTMRALELGAFDFIPKPQSGTLQSNLQAVRRQLVPMIQAFRRSHAIASLLGRRSKPLRSPKRTATRPVRPATAARRTGKSSIVAVGISTGGPNALAQMLPRLPADLGVPVVIVQHMPPVFTQSLAKSLDAKCALAVKEASDGDVLAPNTVYIAPGGKQMKVAAGPDGRNRVLRITNDPPENSCKPSADYLFRSVADHFVGRATGVIMTGMGSDGSAGLKMMKENGAFIIAQDEQTCVVFGMPKEPIESGIVDVVAPLDRIADEIVKTVR